MNSIFLPRVLPYVNDRVEDPGFCEGDQYGLAKGGVGDHGPIQEGLNLSIGDKAGPKGQGFIFCHGELVDR